MKHKGDFVKNSETIQRSLESRHLQDFSIVKTVFFGNKNFLDKKISERIRQEIFSRR